jgi:chaperonin GroEL
MGAKGNTVLIIDKYSMPVITKDGVTVAKSIFFEDVIKNGGWMTVLDACVKTVEQAGDGTTATAVIAQALIKAGIKAIEEGAHPIDVKRGIDETVKEVVKKIKGFSRKVRIKSQDLNNIAAIAANNEPEIGDIVARAWKKVGRYGSVVKQESKTEQTYFEVPEGAQIDRGVISRMFYTSPEKQLCEYNNPLILLYDKKINLAMELRGVIGASASSGRPVLIIAEAVEGEAINTLITNRINTKGFNFVAIHSPGTGDLKKAMMEDLAVLTGGTFIGESMGTNLKMYHPESNAGGFKAEMLGSAKRIVVTNNRCTIIGGGGDKMRIANKISEIKSLLSFNPHKELTQSRLDALQGSIAVIHVGAKTETEMREKMDRVDDAIRATFSALEEGYVAGGGATLMKCKGDNDIVNIALESTFNKIVTNAGIDYYDYKKEIAREGFSQLLYGEGINVQTRNWENLIDSGIIDSTKVVRCALENAASVAGAFLTTQCVIYQTN